MATLVKNGYLGALGGGSGVSLVRRLSNLTRSILARYTGSLYLPSPTTEPLRNLLTYSEDFSNAVWGKTDTTPTAGQLDPLGTSRATTHTQGSTGTAAVLNGTVSTPANALATNSIYVKGTSGFLRFAFIDSATQAIGCVCWVNLATGGLGTVTTLGAASSVSASVTLSANGFYRISLTQSQAATLLITRFQLVTADAGTARVSGGAYTVFGNQLELGTTATAYQQTPQIQTLGGSCYLDVAGTTPCTVDTSVALMLDEMRTLGSELVTNGDFSAGTTGWTLTQPTSGSVGVVAGEMRLNSVDGSAAVFSPTVVTTTIGRTYITTFDARVISGVVNFRDAGGGVIRAVSNGANSFIYQATTANCQFARVGICDVYFDNISVREVTGIHATQATAGFRPVLRGKVKNLATYSDDITNASWFATTSTKTDFETLTVAGASNGLYKVQAVSAGVTYMAQWKVKLGTLAVADFKIALYNETAAGFIAIDVVPTVTPNASDFVTVTYSFTAPVGCTSVRVYQFRNSALVTGTVNIKNYQLELGTVANPYVSTGATVASSSYGPYWLDFDGVDDRMQLSAVPFQMADDSFVVAGAMPLTDAYHSFLSLSVAASANSIYMLDRATTAFSGYFKDSAGSTAGTVTYGSHTKGTPAVYGVRKIGNAKVAIGNGVMSTANNTVVSASAFDTGLIGALTYSAGTTVFFVNGPIYSIALGKGSITDSQLLTIERYVGQKTGVTI